MCSPKTVCLGEALRELRAHFGEAITVPHMLSTSIMREGAPEADAEIDGVPAKVPGWWWGHLADWDPKNDAAEFAIGRISNRLCGATRATGISWSPGAWEEVRASLPPPLSEKHHGFVDRLYRLREAERTIVPVAIDDTDTAALNEPAGTGRAPKTDDVDTIGMIAEWIFTQHPRTGGNPKTKECLKQIASDGDLLGSFTTNDFNTAFRRVYKTEGHRPPLTGWPLREPYRIQLNREKIGPT